MPVLPPPLSDLEVRLGVPVGGLDDTDKARAEAALLDAAALVLDEVPVTKREAWATNAPAVATLVCLKAARREYENPRGFYQESYGEHSAGTRDTSGVYLTADEVRKIRTAAGARIGAYSVRTPSAYTPDPLAADIAIPVEGDGKPVVLFPNAPEV